MTSLTHGAQLPLYLDIWQLIRFIVLALLTAPPNYHWQQFLERSFPAYPTATDHGGRGKEDTELKSMEAGEASGPLEGHVGAGTPEPKFSLQNTLTKWFVDCITAGAVLNTLAFLILMGIMKGESAAYIWSNIRTVSAASMIHHLPPCSVANCLRLYRRRSRSLSRATRSGRSHRLSCFLSSPCTGVSCS